MIEVLVTMLIISLALLGTSGMQAYAMRVNKGSQFRTQAVFLVADLAERMEANRASAVSGGYAITSPTNATDCVTVYCSADDLAASDLFIWQAAVAASLPGGQAAPPVQTVTGNPSTYTITVSWVDRQENTTNAAYVSGATLGADASGVGERFFYTATRTIFN
jgi:type IV pilus assembly protein PilV